ncbi:sensor histidine kinase [Intrasporangium flavum]|uniref:sensor histidine kinase n=1 Tax=Intrasporangium flavum TaxID=1428657 RepID=UPI001A96D271|nr:ATP-binding protein [Intrasporangium flavum]
MAVLVVVAASTLLLSRPLAESLALREAKERSTAFARTVVAPLVDDEVLHGDVPASAPLVRIMQARMADGSIAHMKIWNEDGRVLWSEEPGVTGHSYELEPDVAALFSGTGATAEVSDLDKPENALEQSHEQLIEVYVGFRGTDGRPLVFEAYWPTERIQQDVGDLRWQFTGLGLGALLLLAVALLPLAVSLARRVDRGLAEREEMTAQALSASDLERRRLSQDLHDGLVQDIVGLTYVLPAVSAALPSSAAVERELLDRASADLARSAAGARELLSDLYPADLDSGGLLAAVDDLADRQRRHGLDVRVSVDPGLDETLPVAQMVYRIVREGLRNVARHAAASSVEVEAARQGERVVVEVRDDGVGLARSADGHPADARARHLGLRLLRDTIRTLGGELSARARPGGRGVVLHAEFPVVMGSSGGSTRAGAARPPEP